MYIYIIYVLLSIYATHSVFFFFFLFCGPTAAVTKQFPSLGSIKQYYAILFYLTINSSTSGELPVLAPVVGIYPNTTTPGFTGEKVAPIQPDCC